jgi:hypothetical protein
MTYPFVPFCARASAVSELNGDKLPRIPNLCHLLHSIMSDAMLHYCFFPNCCSSGFYNECIQLLYSVIVVVILCRLLHSRSAVSLLPLLK